MKKEKQIFMALVALVMLISTGCNSMPNVGSVDYTTKVNPFIGTDGPGNVYPGASAPFGMVQLSPDNGTSGWDRIAGYYYPDTTIAGFSMTHLSGTGAGDLYDISFMPATTPYRIARGELGLYSTFKHSKESARAGYYSVYLEAYDIEVELTASERGGVQRYTFPESDSASVFLNLKKSMNWDATNLAHIEILDSQTVQGYRYSSGWAADQKVYFYTRFSVPFLQSEVKDSIAKFVWQTSNGDQIEVKTAISGTSVEGAKHNYEAELKGRDFDDVLESTTNMWNEQLSVIEIEGADKDDEATFYTALYRTMLAPTIYNDANGEYRGGDQEMHKGDFVNYSTFSLWDTYRTAHPLLTLTNPQRIADIVESLVVFCEESGALPVWNMWSNETDMMIGYHSVPVVVEAYLKGVEMDADRVLKACVQTARQYNYRGLGDFAFKGYVPSHEGESVSKTLEYAYDDWCIAVMAKKMGESAIYEEFLARSKNYKNIFKDGFFQPKDSTGKFLDDFNPEAYTEHITESNGWQYRFAVQQDIQAMVDLMGGADRFEGALDSMFSLTPHPDIELPIFSTGMIGQYAHGNEPSHHLAYLYNYIGKPEKAARLVDTILRTQYSNTPEGLCGNEDCGQMSAWYVMSALGFYSVDPVALEYALGVPLYPRATIKLPNGKTFTVVKECSGNQPTQYILNGKQLTTPFITWNDISNGGELIFR